MRPYTNGTSGSAWHRFGLRRRRARPEHAAGQPPDDITADPAADPASEPAAAPGADAGAGDEADACARRFTAALEKTLVTLETPANAGFEHAVRKCEHVEELRRVLAILLDVLADWEMLADRDV